MYTADYLQYFMSGINHFSKIMSCNNIIFKNTDIMAKINLSHLSVKASQNIYKNAKQPTKTKYVIDII